MRGPDGGPSLAAHLVPPAAAGPWLALRRALADRGPVPCSGSSALPPDAWFSTAVDTVELVRLACRMCPANRECGAYALAARERDGIWAGMTAEERR